MVVVVVVFQFSIITQAPVYDMIITELFSIL